MSISYAVHRHLHSFPTRRSSDLWLPEGEWIEWSTGKHFKGPLEVSRKFSIREIPVYVRSGAIVPMAPEMRYTNEKPVDPLTLTVFPLAAGQKSSYTLYEDAGNSRAYETGEAATTKVSASEAQGDLTVEISPAHGDYQGMPAQRAYELRLPGDWPPESVTVNGKPLSYVPDRNKAGWRFEGNTL